MESYASIVNHCCITYTGNIDFPSPHNRRLKEEEKKLNPASLCSDNGMVAATMRIAVVA